MWQGAVAPLVACGVIYIRPLWAMKNLESTCSARFGLWTRRTMGYAWKKRATNKTLQ
jgi:hypothetical protein